MLLTILLALLQATPHVNPAATPVPDSITDPFPVWGWVMIGVFVFWIIVGLPGAIRFWSRTPGQGYVHYGQGDVRNVSDEEKK